MRPTLRRILPALTAAAIVVAWPLLAADEPKRRIPGWGEAIDPDRDCRIAAAGGRLTIAVPGTAHDLCAELDLMNAPRLLHPIKGDFIVQVRVVGTVRPEGQSNVAGHAPFNGAGILLWKDDKNYVRLERAAFTRGAERQHYMNFELRRGGEPVDLPGEVPVIPDQATYLRLERRNGQLIPSTSQDGLQWQVGTPIADEYPGAVSLGVGVAAVNSATTPFTAEFEGLLLFERSAPTESEGEPARQESTARVEPDREPGSTRRRVPLEGAWRVVGVKSEGEEDYQKVDYGQYKLVVDGHFLWASYDRATGEVFRTAGGTYTVEQDSYTERLEYANSEDLRALIGADQKFTWKVQGDQWYHTGRLSNGVRIDELWERAR
jgi:hypothetical protein